MEINQEMAYSIIDHSVPFHIIAGYAGIELPSREGSCFCPFHDNTETPAAKLYRDLEGDRIYCFAEQRMYKPSDLIRKGLLRRDPLTIAARLWEQLSDDTKNQILASLKNPPDTMPANWEEISSKLAAFREGRMTYPQALELLLQLEPPRRT